MSFLSALITITPIIEKLVELAGESTRLYPVNNQYKRTWLFWLLFFIACEMAFFK